MEYIGLIIGTALSITTFVIGRYWSNKDKDKKKIEELEQKAFDSFKIELSGMEKRIGENLKSLEKKLDSHVEKTEENFSNTQKEQKGFNSKLAELEKDNVAIKQVVKGQNELFDQKLNRLDEITGELKEALKSITVTTPKSRTKN
jgi:chromosome segregation ATPase